MKKISILCLILIMVLTACTPAKEKEPTFEEILQSSDTLEAEIESVATITNPSGFPGMQGGCTDGKYYYQSFLSYDLDNQENNDVIIVKYDLETGEIVAQSEVLKLCHANDITYNSKLNRLVICHNKPEFKKVTYMDPETLVVTKTETLNYSIYAIDYNEIRNRYVIGISGGYDFGVLDSMYNTIDIFEGTERVEGYTKQGMCSDDNYIYFVYHNFSRVAVFDWDGNFVTLIHFNVGGETENISVVDGTIYVACAVGGNAVLYKLIDLQPKE